jgi:sugar lactone lactonase YvrE
MKYSIYLFLLVSLPCFGKTLTKVWETEPLMDNPESAVYDAQKDVIYISNYGGVFREVDGNGFISEISPTGEIINLHWVDGLNCPLGLGFRDRKLYAADLGSVVCIDVDDAQIIEEYPSEGGVCFNDLTVDDDSGVYVSDSGGNKLFSLVGNEMKVLSEEPFLQSPNGMLYWKNSLYVLLFNKGIVYNMDLKSKAFTQVCDGIANADGMTSDGEGGFFISGAWQGQIFHMDAQGNKELVLDIHYSQTTADIKYIPKYHLLIAPTLKQTVVAYKWE